VRNRSYERSGYLTRLNTRLSTRVGTSLVASGDSAPAPPAFSGVLDDVVAAGDTVNVALSVSHQLDKDYSGPLIRVRRASDNVEADIGFDASTHMLDEAALAAHCGANNGFVVTVYDQSGNARDFTNATTAEQPKIYDSATGTVLSVDLPLAELAGGAGAAGNGDGWARGDSSGYSLTQAATVYVFGSFTDVATYSRIMFGFGQGAGATLCFRHSVTAGGLAVNTTSNSTDGSARTFTAVTAVGTLSDYLIDLPSGGTTATAACEQRGTAMAAAGAGGALSIATTASMWGSSNTQALGVTGRTGTLIALNAVASAGARTALRDFGADQRTLAGV
jgi:hypothetical protein